MPVYTLPELPYDYAALAPVISPEIIELHHDKHHAGYVKGANDTLEQLAEARDKDQWGSVNGLEKNLAFHLSGHILHSIYWQNMTGDGGGEPLAADGPLWHHPKVTITPHVAALTDLKAAMAFLKEGVRRAESGEPLLHMVDLDRGY